MGYNVKLGKGGHGLEVYDEDGKYASDFSFSLDDGTPIGSYKDYRMYCFEQMIKQEQMDATVEDLENYYQNNIQAKGQIDAMLIDDYNSMVSNAVDLHNAQQTWDTPEETVKHLDELFVPSLVQNLLDNNILNSMCSIVTGNYKVCTFAACLQMSRYKKNKANVISETEYQQRYAKIPSYALQGSLDVHDFREVINTAQKDEIDIPIIRDINGIASSERDEVRKSFFDENSPRHSCLSSYGRERCSYLGSCIYFATNGYEYGGSYSDVRIRGVVKMNKSLRLLECPATHSQVWSDGTQFIPEIVKFRNAIASDSDFDNRMIKRITNNGQVSEQDAKTIVQGLKDEIKRDGGLCAILMGYDAIYGISYHFDILNLQICDLSQK